jgi:DNA-binding winged helix-turn-helix (wHTH) protein
VLVSTSYSFKRNNDIFKNTINFFSNNKLAFIAIGFLFLILVFTAVLLFANLPDANEFNLKVERIFLESDIIPIGNEIRLLEVLANSGTAFSEVLSSYRYIIFTLVIFAMTLLLSTMVFIVLIITLNKKLLYVERAGININSVIINRDKNLVYINDLEFNLTEALFEAIAVLCEARMDDDYLSGVDIESIITGKTITDCEEAAGATRIKRLRDSLGNQIVSELLIRNISGKGYMLSIDKSVIEII